MVVAAAGATMSNAVTVASNCSTANGNLIAY